MRIQHSALHTVNTGDITLDQNGKHCTKKIHGAPTIAIKTQNPNGYVREVVPAKQTYPCDNKPTLKCFF